MRYELNNYADLPELPRLLVLGAREGSGNIGGAVAERQASRGWYVVGDDCSTTDRPDAAYSVPLDLDWAEFDYLVITLGYTSLTPMRDVSDETIAAVIWGSLTLPLLCAREYIQSKKSALGEYVYRPKESGRIVFIGSYAHDHVLTNCSAYCAAKAGLAHAVRTMAWELTPEFLVSIVHPYHVPTTPMGERVVRGLMLNRDMTRAQAEEYQRKDLKLEYHLSPEEIAEYINWMLDAPEAAWLSGQGLNLYGGVR